MALSIFCSRFSRFFGAIDGDLDESISSPQRDPSTAASPALSSDRGSSPLCPEAYGIANALRHKTTHSHEINAICYGEPKKNQFLFSVFYLSFWC